MGKRSWIFGFHFRIFESLALNLYGATSVVEMTVSWIYFWNFGIYTDIRNDRKKIMDLRHTVGYYY